MVRVLKKNYRFSFVSGRITYVFELIREQLLSCWKNIYPWVNENKTMTLANQSFENSMVFSLNDIDFTLLAHFGSFETISFKNFINKIME